MLGALKGGAKEALRMGGLGFTWIGFEEFFTWASGNESFMTQSSPPITIPSLIHGKELGAGIGTSVVWSVLCTYQKLFMVPSVFLTSSDRLPWSMSRQALLAGIMVGGTMTALNSAKAFREGSTTTETKTSPEQPT